MLKRFYHNPIITRNDVPDLGPHLRDVSSVFNPGAVKNNSDYHLILRVQNRGRETFLMMADSNDGVQFEIRKETLHFIGIENIRETIYHIYDPRLTKLEDTFYILFAMDMESGCKLGMAKSDDLNTFHFMGIVSKEDNRNGVLFPERINGKYARFDRPNLADNDGITSGDTISLSYSDDLIHWTTHSNVLSGRLHYWDELIGAGPPPIKTNDGWLLIYHGIATHFQSSNIYQAGVALFDLDDPAKLIVRSRYNILEPREVYELTGQVPNVVFPSGLIVEDQDKNGTAKKNSPVKIYYGAADTCVGLAETTVEELINACDL